MNIIDIFPYFNEKELLELRINLLYDYVDKFIICEANRTQSGLIKDFTVKKTIQELNLPNDKIFVIELDLSSYDNNIDLSKNWHRERAQRNSASNYITQNDVCIVSDCDEIINPLYINYYVNTAIRYPNNILRIPMINLHGRADLMVCDKFGNSDLWCSPFICLFHHTKKYTLSEIREAYSMKNSTFMYSNIEFSDIFITENNVILPSGWHFSWMGNSNRNIDKYRASMHVTDYITNAIYTYSNQSVEDYLKKYKPKEGEVDSLGRRNYLLKKFPKEKLPNKLHELQRVKQFLLPEKKKILFHENQLSERGTTVALYDYAYFGRHFLDVDPIITFNANSNNNNNDSIKKFQKEFTTIPYTNFTEVEKTIDQYQVDYFYAIKHGVKDNILVSNATNLIHSVFNYDINEFHGNIYAVISEWMSFASNYKIPYVPHIVNIPNNTDTLKIELNIPEHALVIGRYGGMDTFDVPFINEVIFDFLNKRKDVWFIFLNTPPVIKHKRCIYLSTNVNLLYKTKFINTCDAMIHGGYRGETFGLSVLEFASKNKQIILFDNFIGGRNHHLLLRNNCHVYLTSEELYSIFNKINKQNPFNTKFLETVFSPENVMNQFQRIFLQ